MALSELHDLNTRSAAILCDDIETVYADDNEKDLRLQWRHNERDGVSNHQRLDF